ncbi:squamosa promoter-binding-like protein 12 isoform X2 [Dendrobium catenatum]|uniref:squamosa promoter-binding-like protein 12 isoform X2 n=1 Tax=Dendrobium catenatum TaxID=906689 RepID=UPI0009F210D3|nr:squamosa promoter-binding-like protein 12 isoform X2 [Dendrobium catenatum]
MACVETVKSYCSWQGRGCTSSSFFSICCGMEWNFKNPLQWDWENLGLFSGKESEVSKSTELSEWRAEGGAISNGSMYSSGSGTCSGSELGNGSLKKTVTASVGFLSKEGSKTSEVNLEAAQGIIKNQFKNYEMAQGEDFRTSPVIVRCVGTGEPPIGLKLGKRTYFENLGSANIKTSSVSMTPPAASVRRSRASHQAIQHAYCQVEGCSIDLTAAKDYHRKHRVCERHSKSPRVIVAGHERRFCQQCSRFHDLCEFDQKKRSCRRRLSDHNARRRKAQPETISFNPSTLPSLFYDERQQMSFFLNLAPFSHVRPSTSSMLDQSDGFSLSMRKGSWLKTIKADVDRQLQFPEMDFSNKIKPSRDGLNRLIPFKCTTNEVLNQGEEAYVPTSNLNGAPDLRRALSLLSSDAWCPSSTEQSSMIQLAITNPITTSNLRVPTANLAPECWQNDNSLAEQALPFNLHGNGSHIQDLQLSKAPYESSFFESNQAFSKSDGHFTEFKT